MRPSRVRRSFRSLASANTAMISEAAAITKPSCRGTPCALPPRPATMLRSSRSFMSMVRGQVIDSGSMFRTLPW